MSIDEKAQSISVMLIKISVYARRKELRERLEHLSFTLLEVVALRTMDAILSTLVTIDMLVTFGKTIYEIEPVSAGIILEATRELYEKTKDMREGSMSDENREHGWVGIDTKTQSLFSGKEIIQLKGRNPINFEIVNPANGNGKNGNSKKETREAVLEKNSDNAAIPSADSASSRLTSSGQAGNRIAESMHLKVNGADNQAMRQSAIFEKVNSLSGKSLQLKDILGLFPDVSERTVRYDLQRLCAEGKIERVGQGGPATYYRARVL